LVTYKNKIQKKHGRLERSESSIQKKTAVWNVRKAPGKKSFFNPNVRMPRPEKIQAFGTLGRLRQKKIRLLER
jgi:hypothetical protein